MHAALQPLHIYVRYREVEDPETVSGIHKSWLRNHVPIHEAIRWYSWSNSHDIAYITAFTETEYKSECLWSS